MAASSFPGYAHPEKHRHGRQGINADGEVRVSGGETTVTTTGGKYYYSQSLTSSPKGVKADGDITISGGKLNISVTGGKRRFRGAGEQGDAYRHWRGGLLVCL